MPAASNAEGLFERDETGAGVYGAIFGGAAFLDDGEFSGLTGPVNLDANVGYNIGAAVGYSWPVRFLGVFRPRSEIEVNYLDTDLTGDGFAFAGGGFASGEQNALSVFANTYYDIELSSLPRLTPFVGGGAGVAFVDIDAFQPLAVTAAPKVASADDTVFIGHFAAGLSYAVNDRLELFSEGRYVRSSNVSVDFTSPSAFRAPDRLEGVTVNAGLRWRF